MPFHAHIYMCTHTHPSWGVGVLSPADSPSITSPVSCHATPDFIIMPPPSCFFFLKCHWHPNTHHAHIIIIFPSFPKPKRKLSSVLSWHLGYTSDSCYFLLPLGLFPLWIVRVCREGPFVTHPYIEPPHSQWNADRSCSKVWLVRRKKYSWGQLSFKYWICF